MECSTCKNYINKICHYPKYGSCYKCENGGACSQKTELRIKCYTQSKNSEACEACPQKTECALDVHEAKLSSVGEQQVTEEETEWSGRPYVTITQLSDTSFKLEISLFDDEFEFVLDGKHTRRN